MTSTLPPVVNSPTARVPGRLEVRAFAGLTMASAAISIDIVLPAFASIREEFGLADDSPATAGLITAFFLGLALGQIPAGLVADRIGRRRTLWIGAALFCVGVVAAMVAPSLTLIIVGRFVWGLGAAAMRVASVAMLRDRFTGAEMAREMAFVMTIFLMVPVIAPSIGAAVVEFFPWRSALVVCLVFCAALVIWQTRLPETLERADRQPLELRQVWVASQAIIASRSALAYTLALIPLQASFASYLGSSERVVGEALGRPGLFPLFFGATAVAMGAASLVVGRNVERIGLHRLIRWSLIALSSTTGIAVVVSVGTGGRPDFWLFLAVFAVVLAMANVANPNLNSAAMVPVGHVAGTAAAVIGTVTLSIGSIIGIALDHAFDGTTNPLTISFFVSGIMALALSLLAGPLRPANPVDTR